MSRQPVVTGLSVRGLLIVFALSAPAQSSSSPAAATSYQPPGEVIIEAQVWNKGHKEVRRPWVGYWYGVPDQKGQAYRLLGELPEPVLGLAPSDFQVFDNGVEQTVNYFRAADKPANDLIGVWSFARSFDGAWGTLVRGPHFDFPPASYVIGYVPRSVSPGECRTVKVIVHGRDVELNRDEYCPLSGSASNQPSDGPTLNAGPLPTNRSIKPLAVSIRTFTFWSSGVLRFGAEGQTSTSSEHRLGRWSYAVEEYRPDSQASVHLDVDLGGVGSWNYPCHKDEAPIKVLAIVRTSDGHLAVQHSWSYSCFMTSKWSIIYAGEDNSIHAPEGYVLAPNRLDTQISLRPGDYDLEVVVSNGYNSGRAHVPLHVDKQDYNGLTLSDLVVGGVVRSTEWVLRDAATTAPGPIVPTPLVSKDLEYFPDSLSAVYAGKGTPVYIYFEIYQPQIKTRANPYYQWQIFDQKTGSKVMSSQLVAATDSVVPGSAVIPIGLKIDVDKLQQGSYELKVQASDSAGRDSVWRTVKFSIP